MTKNRQPPTPAEIIALRQRVEVWAGVSAAEAKQICTDALYTTNRAWRMWESGDRPMNLAFWELAKKKLNR